MALIKNLWHYLHTVTDPVMRRTLSGIFALFLDTADPRRIVVGSSSARAVRDEADLKFMQMYIDNGATSGDNRALYLRLYITGAGGGGEAARIFTTVEDVAASSAHGAHISLNFGTSGTVTGQGIAMRATLHLPSTALASNVTLAAVQAEIYSDAATSDPGGSTLLSYFRAVNGGDATGGADVDDDAVLLEIIGTTAGAAKMFATGLTPATVYGNLTASLKIRIGSTIYYIPLATAIT